MNSDHDKVSRSRFAKWYHPNSMGTWLPGFEIDFDRSRLLRNGQDLDLEPKVFDLLRYFLKHPNRLVSKRELKSEVWNAERLSDGVTANAVAKLRRALAQSTEATATIETIRTRGYIFRLATTALAPNAPAAAPRSESLPLPEEAPLVGRQQPLHELTHKLERARSGATALVVIRGAAGIGKTRVVHELIRRAAQQGTPSWIGAAYEGEGFPAYWPWMQILRQAQNDAPSAFARALPKGAQFLPQWTTGLHPSPPVGPPVEPHALRFRLFDELTRCLRALASEGPRLVVLDDLQWADAGSIELLGHLVQALSPSPILFVAILREDEPLSRSVEDALSRLSRFATRVRLTGLSADESDALARSLCVADPPSDTQLRALFQRSGGNPFFIRQFLEWWAEVGPDEARRQETPPGARDLIRRRLSGLPPEARRVLAAASVLGMQFRASRLALMLHEPAQTVLEALSVGSRLTLIAALRGTDEFAFTHALLQETLYEDIDLQTRGDLHSHAANTFGADRASLDASYLGEQARHLVHALPSRLVEAVSACKEAASAAQSSAGFERAHDLLALALKKLEAEGASPEEQALIWMELGDNHYFGAELDLAWQAYHQAAELLRSAGRSEQMARLLSQLVRSVSMGTGDADFARGLINEVLNKLPQGARRERSLTLAKKAQLAWELSSTERAALLEEAATCADDPAVRLEVAYARTMLRDPSTLEANAQAALDFMALIETETADPIAIRYRALHQLAAHTTQYLCAATACDLERATEVQSAISALAERSHMRAAEVMLAVTQTGRALAAGRLDEAGVIATRGDSPTDAYWIRAAFRTYQLMLLEARGALALLDKLELPPLPELSGSAVRLRTDFAIVHAYLYLRTGRTDRARDMLRHLSLRDIERMPVLYGDLGALTGLATLYVELNNEVGARLIYDRLLPFAGRNALTASFAFRGAVDHFLGLLSRHLGESLRAREHLKAAVAINRGLGMPRETFESEALLAAVTSATRS